MTYIPTDKGYVVDVDGAACALQQVHHTLSGFVSLPYKWVQLAPGVWAIN